MSPVKYKHSSDAKEVEGTTLTNIQLGKFEIQVETYIDGNLEVPPIIWYDGNYRRTLRFPGPNKFEEKGETLIAEFIPRQQPNPII